eukprot:SAG11_NODE_2605_length_3179_cov_1.752273_1_plen_40_part_00
MMPNVRGKRLCPHLAVWSCVNSEYLRILVYIANEIILGP